MSDQTGPDWNDARSADALVDRLMAAALGTFDLFAITLGHRLGYYRALAVSGPLSSTDLAGLTNTNERYTREWLEQQAVTGLLDVVDVTAADLKRTYRLPDVYRGVLTESGSLLAGIPIARSVVGSVAPFERLVDAYRSGEGIPFSEYGIDMLEGQESTNRASFEQKLATEWIPRLPEVEARLRQDDPARIADIGMGAGWSSIAFAKAYPNVVVDGFDLDPASVALAERNARDHGVDHRVTFSTRDAGDHMLAGQYDLVTAFECIHDMANPVAALASMRRLAGDRGTVLVMDDKVADVFDAPGSLADRYLYGFSILHCLPVGMAEQPSAATGAIMRTSTFETYAREAGFSGVDVLPIETEFSRFYRLVG